MHPWTQKSKILVTCPKGASAYLKKEIEDLGFTVRREIDTTVQTEGTLEDTLLLNLHLRTAQRVLYQLQSFKVVSPGELYAKLNALPWEDIVHGGGKSAYLCVTSIVDNPSITDSRFVNMKVKDAVVDRIREKTSRRPDSGPEKDKAVIHLYWKNDQATVYIDTSGERLSMRGYRKIPLQAPMQETLAAAVIMATGWRENSSLVNPMCGSGTLAIEAALMALGRAPGLTRTNFGFMHIRGFSQDIWQELRERAREAVRKTLPFKIIASDIDDFAVKAAKINARGAGVDHTIDFLTCSFAETPLPHGRGIIILNPPYGERLEAREDKPARDFNKKETRAGKTFIIRKGAAAKEKPVSGRQKLETLYAGIGDFFKSAGASGSRFGYIFTGNLEMAKSVGLRTKQRMLFYNGDIECRLLEYELYADSRRRPKSS
ncbi:MAG TPA: class I SAM-dependent RNA methyltransferase [Smithellaceae bacterium]|nr:class I SAM-dependent RNA methyltransferase [Smithellaceae bacterium]HRV26339.1 class I SAM-dependent RNA methyltransferase [Smithellaceae bacterium]